MWRFFEFLAIFFGGVGWLRFFIYAIFDFNRGIEERNYMERQLTDAEMLELWKKLPVSGDEIGKKLADEVRKELK